MHTHHCQQHAHTFDLCDRCAPAPAQLAYFLQEHLERPIRYDGSYAYFDAEQSTTRDSSGVMQWATQRVALRLEWRIVRDYLGY